MGDTAARFERQVRMGLGEAVLRLVHVELKYANGIFEIPDYLKQERDLIVQALNQYELDLGFDCDNDGVPDTVEIFKQTAETSCCRVLPKDTSRKGSKGSTSSTPPATTATPTEPNVGPLDAPEPHIKFTPPTGTTPPTEAPAPKAARGDISRRKR